MTDIFSTHTSDSYVWWVLCSGNQIRWDKMLKMPPKCSFSFQMMDEKCQDDAKEKALGVLILWFVVVGASPYAEAKCGGLVP